jgi:uncharacterized membrane protein YkoI
MTKLSFTFQSQFILDRFNGKEHMMIHPEHSMKIKHIIGIAFIAALLAGCASEENHKEARQAALMAEAKVSQADARATALAQVPNGTVKESELEKEHGKLIWSFDIATTGTKDITEVNVDAVNGTVVSKEIEKEKDEKD